MPNIRDLIEPAELIGVVRQLEFPEFALRNVIPQREVNDIMYAFARGNEDRLQAAAVRAFDAESPIGSRPGVTRVAGQLPPISLKIPLTEGDRLMRDAYARSNAGNAEFIDAIFDDAARMVRGVQARIELARGDALVDGIVTINENGMQFTVDYGVPAAHKVVAAASWATGTTDILGDIANWVQTYVDANGTPPARAITSTRVINYMLRNAAIRDLAGAGTASFITREALDQIMGALALPTVTPYDVQVYNTAGVKTRVIPDDRFIMLPEDGVLGRTEYGTTVEALELAGDGLLPADSVPGVVAVTWKTVDPVQIWTKGAAIALPIITNPALLFSADVA